MQNIKIKNKKIIGPAQNPSSPLIVTAISLLMLLFCFRVFMLDGGDLDDFAFQPPFGT
jgi:hypothetical protein